jgi:hypothetical protein
MLAADGHNTAFMNDPPFDINSNSGSSNSLSRCDRRFIMRPTMPILIGFLCIPEAGNVANSTFAPVSPANTIVRPIARLDIGMWLRESSRSIRMAFL